MPPDAVTIKERNVTFSWPEIGASAEATDWLRLQVDLGLAPLTVVAYARGLSSFLQFCREAGVEPLREVQKTDVLGWIREMKERPVQKHDRTNIGLANATMQQRLVAVRLFYDYLVEEGIRKTNPAGRGQFTPGRTITSRADRGLLPRDTPLPWIPTDEQWQAFLSVSREEPIRNRLMLALAYDAGLRREELCGLRTDDLDPAHRTLRVRAETTKSRRERVVPYSATAGALLQAYLKHRRQLSRERGPLFLSESRRNSAAPITLWTWSKVVRALALRAGVPSFSTHTLRHLCLTDLARAGWEIHAIAQFAGHRSTNTTLQYIHLSGRDLATRLASGMEQVHRWRMDEMARAFEAET